MDQGWEIVFFKQTVFCYEELFQFWVRPLREPIGFFNFLDVVLGMSYCEVIEIVIPVLDQF